MLAGKKILLVIAGGIAAFNRTLDAKTADAITKIFTEVVIAPSVSEAAREVLRDLRRPSTVPEGWKDD